MPTLTLEFTNAGAAGAWQNSSNALAAGGGYAGLAPDATNGWLILSELGSIADLSLDAVISDVKVRVVVPAHATFPPGAGETATIDIAVTTDGWSPLGGPLNVPYVPGTTHEASAGPISRAAVASPVFGAMVRRGTGGTEATEVERRIDRIEILITYTVPSVSGGAMAETRAIGLQRRVVGFMTSATDNSTNPDVMLKAAYPDLRPSPTYEDIGTGGQLLPGDRFLTYEDSVGELTGPDGTPKADYNEMFYFLCMNYGKPVTTNPATGVERHEWNIDPRQYVQPGLLVMHTGDINVGEEHRHVFMNSLTLGGSKKTHTIGGSFRARKQTDRTGKPGGSRNAVQTFAFTGAPTGGNVTVSYKGKMATFSATANAGAIATALTALSTIGAGNVTVAGSGPYTVTGAGDLAGVEMAQFIVETKALTGGTSPDFTVTMTTQGGWKEYELAPFTGLQSTLYLSDTVPNIGRTADKIGELYEWNLEASDRFETRDVVGRTDDTFKGLVPQPWSWIGTLGLQADIDAQAKATLARANGSAAARYLRYEFVSPQEVKPGYAYSLTIDLYGKLRDTGEVKAFGQVKGRTFAFDTHYDANNWGRSGRIVLVCAVPNTMP